MYKPQLPTEWPLESMEYASEGPPGLLSLLGPSYLFLPHVPSIGLPYGNPSVLEAE
jgi:hypothetical protein